MNLNLELFRDYLTREGKATRTKDEYLRYASKFIGLYASFNQDSINNFLNDKSNNNVVGKSFIKSFRSFLLANYKALGITQEAIIDIKGIEIPKIKAREKSRIPGALSQEEVIRVRDCLEDEEHKLMFDLALDLGLRLQELMRLTPSSFNFPTWKLNPSKYGEARVIGKGNKEGIAIVSPQVMENTRQYLKNLLMPIDEKIFKKSSRDFQRKLLEASIKAGVTLRDSEGKLIKSTVVHPHKLRHTCATNYIKKGVDIVKVKELLRHSNISSTQIYTHINKEDLKRELEGLNK